MPACLESGVDVGSLQPQAEAMDVDFWKNSLYYTLEQRVPGDTEGYLTIHTIS